CLNQRSIDGEVLVGQKPFSLGLLANLEKELPDNVCVQQPVAVLRKGRVVPHLIIHRKAYKPSKQQVVVQLLHQQPFASNRIEHLQQKSSDQFLRRNR